MVHTYTDTPAIEHLDIYRDRSFSPPVARWVRRAVTGSARDPLFDAEIAALVPGLPMEAMASLCFAVVILKGRPPFRPRVRAEASPARACSVISSRSNSAAGGLGNCATARCAIPELPPGQSVPPPSTGTILMGYPGYPPPLLPRSYPNGSRS